MKTSEEELTVTFYERLQTVMPRVGLISVFGYKKHIQCSKIQTLTLSVVIVLFPI